MNKRLIFILLLFLHLSAGAQNWAPVSGDRFNIFLERVLYDSIHDELIASSKFVRTVGNLYVRGIASWNGTTWDSLSSGINTFDTANTTPFGMVLGCIPYQGKLLVGGMFGSIGGINATCLATWDGAKWDSLPVRAFKFSATPPQVAGFYQVGNLLYIYGTFDSIAGQNASGLATWDGTNFKGIVLPASTVIGVKGIIEFKHELYVCGNFFNPGIADGLKSILRFDGSNWVSVGGSLVGLNAGINSMIIYKNELYVGGHFLISDGNEGENIMKWNGSQWQDIGFGGELYGQVNQMLVFKNKLWAVGAFQTAAHIPASSIASYDGEHWCIPKDSINNTIQSITEYHDTLYIGGGFTNVYGDTSISNIAKIQDPNLYRECNPTILVNAASASIIVYPNPFTSEITLSSETLYQNLSVTICNTLGQSIYSSILTIDTQTTISLPNIKAGLYYIKIQNGSQTISAQKIINVIQ
jgi:hypothetical protein